MNDILNCDFIVGDMLDDIKEMDTFLLTNLKYKFQRKTIGGPIYLDKGAVSYFWKNRNQYDIILLGGDAYSISVWIVLFLSKFTGKKVVIWTHGYYGKEGKATTFMKKWFYGMADRLFLYGDYAKKGLAEHSIVPENKSVVVYNSLDYDAQLRLRNKVGSLSVYKNHFKNDNPNVIFIGRLAFVKKLDLLISAAAKLRDSNFNINITFIGDGEAAQALKELSAKYNLGNIWFYGGCYDQTVLSEMIYNADLCVSPGNVGLTAMHCLMFGCPVITHDNFAMQMPEFEAIEHGISGNFFEYGNVDSLAASIKTRLTNNLSREEIRKKCYEVMDGKYNPQSQIVTMQNTFNELRK